MGRYRGPSTDHGHNGGSEFRADFESACKESGIKLFVLPLRSPKLNGHVERAQRTYIEEFYEVYDGELEIIPAELGAARMGTGLRLPVICARCPGMSRRP